MPSIADVSVDLRLRTKEFVAELNASRTQLRSLGREAAKTTAMMRPPMEAYTLQHVKLNAMLALDKISHATHASAVGALKTQYATSMPILAAYRGGLVGIGGAAQLAGARIKTSLAGLGAVGRFIGPMAVGYGMFRAAKGANEFETSLRSSLAIMGDIDPKTKKALQTQAFDVSRNTKFSPSEVAAGYFPIVSSGFSPEDSLKLMPEVAKFAQAGNFDLGKSAELLGDSMNSLGMKTDDSAQNLKNMTRLSDLLSKANVIGSGTTEDFATALARSGGSFRTYRVGLAEGMSMLVAFASANIKGEEAATAIAIVLRDLQNAAIGQSKAFKDAGIDVYDFAGELRKPADIIKDMEKALAGMSVRDIKITLETLGFPEKSLRYIMQLIGTGGKLQGFADQLSEMASAGSTAEQAGKQMTEFSKGWQSISASMKEFNVDTITPMLEALGLAFQQAGQRGGGFSTFLKDLSINIDDVNLKMLKLLKWNSEWALTLHPFASQKDINGTKLFIEQIDVQIREMEKGLAAKRAKPTAVVDAALAGKSVLGTPAAGIVDSANAFDFDAAFAKGLKKTRQENDAANNKWEADRLRSIEQQGIERQKALKAEARAMDPLKAYQDQMAHIEMLRGQGLSDVLADKAMKEARKQAISGIMGGTGQVDLQSAMSENSAEAYRAIVRGRVNATDPALEAAKKQLRALQDAVIELKGIRREAKPPQPVEIGAA